MSDVAPLDETTWERLRDHVDAHDHAIAVYDDDAGLERALGKFVEDGHAANDLMVFVHSCASDREAWDLLEAAYPGVTDLKATEVFVVSLYKQAFQGEKAAIDHEHVAQTVGTLVRKAEESDRRALRLFVDASRMYFQEARLDEWFAFESWLGRRLQSRAGLVCAYRRADVLRSDIFPRALETHAYRFG